MSVKQYLLDDGSSITARELAAELGIHIASARKRLKRTNAREKVFEAPRCRRERVYTRDGVSYTASGVCREVPGLSTASAASRALLWERGEISMEQLLLPKGQYRGGKDSCNLKNRGSALWQELGSKPRDAALKNIPGATRWEKKHRGEI